MSAPKTLRRRFAVSGAALFFASALVLGTVLFFTMNYFLHASLKDSLQVTAHHLVAGLDVDNGVLTPPDSLDEGAPPESHPEGFTERLLSPAGKVLRQNGPFAAELPLVQKPFQQAKFSDSTNRRWECYSVGVFDEGRLLAILQVAQSTLPINETLNQLFWAVLFSIAVFLPLSAISGYLLAAQLLKPIDALTQTAGRFSATDLSARLNLPQTHDELGRLAHTFDLMLSRIEEAFQNYRHFISDASHELKTPLAILHTIVNVTRSHVRTPGEYALALDDISQAVRRLETLAGHLLTLARIEGEPTLDGRCIDLSDLGERVLATFGPLIQTKGLVLRTQIEPQIQILGDETLLTSLVTNLVDNALKFTDHGQIDFHLRRAGTEIILEVQDTGIGIPPDQATKIFERFFRGGTAREGSGLGLAIVASLVKLHRGTVKVESIPEKGSRFIVNLPAFQNKQM